jgi:hypothetical protein
MSGNTQPKRTSHEIQALRENVCRELRFDLEAISRLESEGGCTVPVLPQTVPPAIARNANAAPESFHWECEGGAT